MLEVYRYYHPIEVRYGDLDPQGHVNNAKYLTYMEQARVGYIRKLGLWQTGSYLDIGIILAEVRVAFRAPIVLEQAVQVGVRTSRLGNKSLVMEYSLVDSATSAEMATGSAVLVTYDYRARQSISLPVHWRKAIAEFEGLPDIETV